MNFDASSLEQSEVQEIASVEAAFQGSKLVSQPSKWQAPLDASPTLTPQSSCADLEAAPSDVSSSTDLQAASEPAFPAWLQHPSRQGREHPRNGRARMKPPPSNVLGSPDVGQQVSRRAGLRAQGDTVLASVHGHVAPLKGKRQQKVKTQNGPEAKAVTPTGNVNGVTPKANANGAKSAALLQQRNKKQQNFLTSSAGASTGSATLATSTAPPRLAMPSSSISSVQLQAAVAAYLSTKQLPGICTADSARSGAAGSPQSGAAAPAFDVPMRMDVHGVAKNHMSKPPPGLSPPPGL